MGDEEEEQEGNEKEGDEVEKEVEDEQEEQETKEDDEEEDTEDEEEEKEEVEETPKPRGYYPTDDSLQENTEHLDVACRAQLNTGRCRGYFRKFGYSSKHQKCIEFIHGGCKVNANVFSSYDSCTNTCGNDVREKMQDMVEQEEEENESSTENEKEETNNPR